VQLIAAVDRNWAIGRDGDQLAYLKADLKRFKALTTAHTVILGRRTLATFPGGRPLPGRRNLVLSGKPDFRPQGAEVFSSLETLLAVAPPMRSSLAEAASIGLCCPGATGPT
jgi:dihydrofolate reductase